MDFLQDWLADHIQRQNRKHVPSMMEKGTKQTMPMVYLLTVIGCPCQLTDYDLERTIGNHL